MAEFQILLFLLVLVALVKPLGAYMARVYEGERTWPARLLGPLERLIYRGAGVDPAAESTWQRYAATALLANFVGFVAVYLLQRAQAGLPLNPEGFAGVAADSAFNTALRCETNSPAELGSGTACVPESGLRADSRAAGAVCRRDATGSLRESFKTSREPLQFARDSRRQTN